MRLGLKIIKLHSPKFITVNTLENDVSSRKNNLRRPLNFAKNSLEIYRHEQGIFMSSFKNEPGHGFWLLNELFK